MGVLSLPYFITYRSGEVVDRFTLNLTKVDKLRSAIANLTQHSLTSPSAASSGEQRQSMELCDPTLLMSQAWGACMQA